MHIYSTIVTQHFILELILFLAKIRHVISYLVTLPLVLMAAWILFGIVEYRTFRPSVFKAYQIIKHFSRFLSFIIGIPPM